VPYSYFKCKYIWALQSLTKLKMQSKLLKSFTIKLLEFSCYDGYLAKIIKICNKNNGSLNNRNMFN